MVDGVANNQLGGLPPMTVRDRAKPAGVESRSTEPAAAKAGVSVQLCAVQAGEPPIDTAKVADVKAAIAAGSYKIDANSIAAAMVRDL